MGFGLCCATEAVLPLPATPCRTGLGGSDRARLCPGGGGGGLFFRVELPPPPLMWDVRGREVGGPVTGPGGGTNSTDNMTLNGSLVHSDEEDVLTNIKGCWNTNPKNINASSSPNLSPGSSPLV